MFYPWANIINGILFWILNNIIGKPFKRESLITTSVKKNNQIFKILKAHKVVSHYCSKLIGAYQNITFSLNNKMQALVLKIN